MIKVHGVMLDITNLRNAEYTIGTPLEDAKMRDLTINSLFFNVNESKVEDFTGKGFPDLMAGRIQTPSDPVWTFKYDAVQLLRAIRFSSRFQFEIDPQILEAASDEEVRRCIHSKVSRERIGKELDKIFEGNHPEASAALLQDLDLLKLLYKIPDNAVELQD